MKIQKYFRLKSDFRNPKHDKRTRYGVESVAVFKAGSIFCQWEENIATSADPIIVTNIASARFVYDRFMDGVPEDILEEIPTEDVPLRDRVQAELGDCHTHLMRRILEERLVSFEQLEAFYLED